MRKGCFEEFCLAKCKHTLELGFTVDPFMEKKVI